MVNKTINNIKKGMINIITGGSLFANAFREDVVELGKKLKDPSLAKEDGYPICIPTTLTPFDYRNGMKVCLETRDQMAEYQYDAIGLGTGSLNMLIGKNGCAKTAAAIQMGCGIAQRFPSSFVTHLDMENGTNKMRVKNLSGWNSGMIDDKYFIKSGPLPIETVKKLVIAQAESKLRLRIQYPDLTTYFTGTYDVNGNKVYEMVPTVIILDSVPMLYESSGEMSNMDGARTAKAIADMVKTIMPYLVKANIIFIAINHINQKINTGFLPTPSQNNYLGQDESISGGNTLLYLCNNVIKMTSSTKLMVGKNPFGDFTGFHSNYKLIKSRSNCSGQECEMIYNQEYGFDRLLSMFQMVKNADLLHGSGWYYLEGLPSVKFQQKTFKEKLHDNDMFKYAFKQLVQHAGSEYLSGNAKIATQTEDEMKASMDDFVLSLRSEMEVA
jgi:RecA/RadA recombinase